MLEQELYLLCNLSHTSSQSICVCVANEEKNAEWPVTKTSFSTTKPRTKTKKRQPSVSRKNLISQNLCPPSSTTPSRILGTSLSTPTKKVKNIKSTKISSKSTNNCTLLVNLAIVVRITPNITKMKCFSVFIERNRT